MNIGISEVALQSAERRTKCFPDVHGYIKSHCFHAVNTYYSGDAAGIVKPSAFNRVLSVLDKCCKTYRTDLVAKRKDVKVFVREVKRLKKGRK